MIKKIVPQWLVPLGRGYKKPKDWADNLRPDPAPPAQNADIPGELRQTARKAQEATLSSQNTEEGYWCADLKSDCTCDCDTIMLYHFLGRGNSIKIRKLANP